MFRVIKDSKEVQEIFPLLDKVKHDYNAEAYQAHIINKILDDDTLCLVHREKNGIINGFLYAEVLFNIDRKEVFVALAYLKTKNKNTGKDFMTLLSVWGRQRGCKNITCLVRPDRARAWQKKYGFRIKRSYLTKEIKLEDSV